MYYKTQSLSLSLGKDFVSRHEMFKVVMQALEHREVKRLLGQNGSRLIQCSVSKCGQKGDTQGIKTEESLSWYTP